MCVCVCVCVCARARVRVRACVCVCVSVSVSVYQWERERGVWGRGERNTMDKIHTWEILCVFGNDFNGVKKQQDRKISISKWLEKRPYSYRCILAWDLAGIACLVRAPDSWSKGCEFESRQERRENFLLRSQLSVLTLIPCPFHPRVTTVARKRPRSFCPKCTWQVTPKHAYTPNPTKSE